MFEKFMENFKRADIVIGAAAVGDFTPVRQKGKIKRQGSKAISLLLNPTQDIMAWAGKHKGKKVLVGYAAQSGSNRDEALRKIKDKNLDFIVYNDITAKNSGFGSDDNEIAIIDNKAHVVYEGRESKEKLAQIIVNLVAGRGRK
jgi:phosphopantothenoylcysteine decarboxylase / phosphopantothenate---cysteine ligase